MNDIGFTVVYRWELKPGREDSFIQAWRKVTELIRDQRGGLGSRLHKAADGTWVAYAQWPDRATWERMQAAETVDEEAIELMNDAIAKRYPPLLLEPVADLLVDPGEAG